MCSLYHQGIPVHIAGSMVTIKFGIFLGRVDLQAKSYNLHIPCTMGKVGVVPVKNQAEL